MEVYPASLFPCSKPRKAKMIHCVLSVWQINFIHSFTQFIHIKENYSKFLNKNPPSSTLTTAPLLTTSVKLLKFVDDTTVIGLIQDGDESAYRQQVKELAVWCSHNNLELPLRNKNICEYIGRYNVIYEIIYFDCRRRARVNMMSRLYCFSY